MTTSVPISHCFLPFFEANATRTCHLGGVWDNRTDYGACVLADAISEAEGTVYLQAIFCTGYCFSLLGLVLSLFILLRYKSLHCLRNHIHVHLMVTLVIRVVAWLTLYGTTKIDSLPLMYLYNATTSVQACASLAMLCWMFIEGAHLLKIIYWTYGLHQIRLWHYALFGWGVPAILVSIWTAINAVHNPSTRWIEQSQDFYLISLPSLVILACNTLVLISIIYTLLFRLKAPKVSPSNGAATGVTRRRNRSASSQMLSIGLTTPRLDVSTDTAPTSSCDPHHRLSLEMANGRIVGGSSDRKPAPPVRSPFAFARNVYKPKFRLPARFNRAEFMRSLKACLMLVPLLGIPQVIFIVPYHASVVRIFTYINAIVTSTQGFWVALIFCFLNEEVRLLLRNSFQNVILQMALRKATHNAQRRRHSPQANLPALGV
uniref:G_PROTEIN_RECEP_F2_4 domain-containing protein n=1 Tax=Mesocestoides corti TaxID=53468 RepID=A0A5K3FUZ3_MESCO